MDIRAVIGMDMDTPSFEDERDALAAIFADVAKGDNTTLRYLAAEFFDGTVDANHAINEIIPLQLERRLDITINMLRTVGAARDALSTQKEYVLQAPVFQRVPQLRTETATELANLSASFDRLSTRNYNRGLKLMRELRAFDIKTTAYDGLLMQMRFKPLEKFPAMEGMGALMTECHAQIIEQHDHARNQDLDMAQFRLQCVGAGIQIPYPPIDRFGLAGRFERARELFDDANVSPAPGLADLDHAANIYRVILPMMRP